jgi:TRAP transporter TAXI family solute receptor
MKKRVLVAVVLSVCFFCWMVPHAGATSANLPKRLEFSSHPTGSTGNATGLGFSKVASEKGPIMVVMGPTTGPLAWVKQMSDLGNPQLGNANSLDMFWMYFNEVAPVPVPDQMLGDKPFYPQAFKNLRIIASGGRMSVGFLVLDKSPYKSVQDLKGARLASGYRAQPSAFSPMIADLVNAGMTLKDFKEVTVTSPGAGIVALGEGRVDVVSCGVGMAQAAEVNSREKVRFLAAPTDPAGVKRAQSIIPGASYTEPPTGPAGLEKPTPLLTFAQIIICNESLPDAVVESLLTTWWDNIADLRPLHPSLATLISPAMLFEPKAAMPYHNGAIAFFKKKGVWDAKQDVYQERLLKGEKPFLD